MAAISQNNCSKLDATSTFCKSLTINTAIVGKQQVNLLVYADGGALSSNIIDLEVL